MGWPGIPDFDPPPFVHDGIYQKPVPLSEEEVNSFYYGFCNGTLWPLYHDAVVAPEFHRHTWKPYIEVNQRYADETAKVVNAGDIAWVQD